MRILASDLTKTIVYDKVQQMLIINKKIIITSKAW